MITVQCTKNHLKGQLAYAGPCIFVAPYDSALSGRPYRRPMERRVHHEREASGQDNFTRTDYVDFESLFKAT